MQYYRKVQHFMLYRIAPYLFQAIYPFFFFFPLNHYEFQACHWVCWQALLAYTSPADFISTLSAASCKSLWKHCKLPNKHLWTGSQPICDHLQGGIHQNHRGRAKIPAMLLSPGLRPYHTPSWSGIYSISEAHTMVKAFTWTIFVQLPCEEASVKNLPEVKI